MDDDQSRVARLASALDLLIQAGSSATGIRSLASVLKVPCASYSYGFWRPHLGRCLQVDASGAYRSPIPNVQQRFGTMIGGLTTGRMLIAQVGWGLPALITGGPATLLYLPGCPTAVSGRPRFV